MPPYTVARLTRLAYPFAWSIGKSEVGSNMVD
jgi:hypothetical protein